jgi:hypothetical protein
MRRIIYFGSLLVILVLLSILISRNLKRMEKQENKYSIFQQEDFKFLTAKDGYFEENIVIIFFSSTCGVCEIEAKQVEGKKPDFVDFIFVSPEREESILSFAKKTGLLDMKGIYLAQIDTLLIREKYKPQGVPVYIIYQNDILIQRGKGLLDLNNINQRLQLINE